MTVVQEMTVVPANENGKERLENPKGFSLASNFRIRKVVMLLRVRVQLSEWIRREFSGFPLCGAGI